MMTKEELLDALQKLRQDVKDVINEKKKTPMFGQQSITFYERLKSTHCQDIDRLIRLVDIYYQENTND